ncbi:TadE/TadG family type IV pilus assembly protein [Symbiobacterium terraclitae]|uniref:TadE/TadG family type IV pilus assembly protein n=1 Tax=Symbiobacterium terraclitae TaxID=557451 RepID=UPI0035B50771
MRFLRDSRGNATSIMGAVAILTAISAFALVFDLGYLVLKQRTIKRALDYANLATFREIDRDLLQEGVIHINELPAQDTFLEFLRHNLRLDYNLDPLPGSVATGTVVVDDFIIYNSTDLPALDPRGRPVTEVSVYSRITVPVQPVFTGLFGPVNLPVVMLTDAPSLLVVPSDP